MKHIYSKGKLDEVETRKYMRQIISSVDHLHRAGIIHRYTIIIRAIVCTDAVSVCTVKINYKAHNR